MMGPNMLNMDTSTKQSKESLKSWIKHRVPARGDKVFWGKNMREEVGLREHQGGARVEREALGNRVKMVMLKEKGKLRGSPCNKHRKSLIQVVNMEGQIKKEDKLTNLLIT